MLVKELIEKVSELEENHDEAPTWLNSESWDLGYSHAINDICCILYDIQEQQIRDEFTADELIEILKAKEFFTIDLDARDVLNELLSSE